MGEDWQYHQDGRDSAAATGCIGCLGFAVLVFCMLIAACSL